jgi:hypothetical protein
MTFDELLSRVHDLLQHQGRLSYRALKRRFNLNDDDLEDLKAELIRAQRLAIDEDGEVLVWTGRPERLPALGTGPSRAPLTYTPLYLAEKILTSRGMFGIRVKTGHKNTAEDVRAGKTTAGIVAHV